MTTSQAAVNARLTTPVDRPTMRAVAQDRYGGPDVLTVADVPRPVPDADQALVRVDASSVNARDWHIMRGEPRVARVLDRDVFARNAPRVPVRGTDFAGTVVAVGDRVTRWRVGDRIFGEAEAAWAEYLVAAEDAVAAMPHDVTAAEAAALPLAATTALMCLSARQLASGDRILINGASGGVGTFALQMARDMDLQITAVCSARNADQAILMGAHRVIDYAIDDFCATRERYDLVVDLVGNRSVRGLRSLLKPTGTLVLSGGGVPGTGRIVGPIGLLARAQLISRTAGPRIVIPKALPTSAGLAEVARLAGRGVLVPVIDGVFSIKDAARAMSYVETEHPRGKVVIDVSGAATRPAP